MNDVHNNNFRDFMKDVESIKFIESFAETLGALNKESVALEYSFIDVVKMAGHARGVDLFCPSCCIPIVFMIQSK